MTLKSIYDIELNSADGQPGFLQQFKGKAAIVVNTTVGCGNANQMEVLQWLQDKYAGDDFQIIAIPTNDYCGPGVTKGKWSEGITCGADSASYGAEVYGTTFQFAEMVASIPHPETSLEFGGKIGHNGLGQPYGDPHELYAEIKNHQLAAKNFFAQKGFNTLTMNKDRYYSWWLNRGFYEGTSMGGNFEKYLIDKDGYVDRHYSSTVLNWDIEKTLKEAEENQDVPMSMGIGRSKKVFEEEWSVVCQNIEELIAGRKSVINPVNLN